MIVAALLTAVTLSAQPTLTKGMEGKRLSVEDLQEARYIGTQNKLDAWIMEGKRHIKQVVLTDLNLEPVSIAPIAGSGDLDVLAASVTPDRTGVLLANRESKKRTIVLRCEVDAESKAIVEPFDTVVAFEYGRKDDCWVWGATSPSGLYNALVCVLQFNETKQYKTYVALFDSRMQPLWHKEYPLGSITDVMVTDAGRIVTFGEEREEEESHLVFNMLDTLNAETLDVSVKCDPVKDLHLRNVVGSNAILMGTYHPMGKKREHITAGVIGISFNLDSASLVGLQMRPFQNEDMNIFLNKKTKKLQKETTCDHIVILGCVPTPYGAAMALGHDMAIEKNSNSGSVSRSGYGIGVHVAAVDTTGRICWVRNFRRNDVTKNSDLPTLGFACAGDKVCVVKAESAKMPAIYEISNEAKEFTLGDKGNVVVYSVSPDGTTEKLLLEPKSKHVVFQARTRLDDTLLIFSERGSKTRLFELRW